MSGQQDSVDEIVAQWRHERPDLDSSALEVVLRIPIAADHLEARLRQGLLTHGLFPWEFDVLSALRRTGAPHTLSPTELCKAGRLSSGAMTNRIDRLEDRELVVRQADQNDRRSIAVKLTTRGRALIDRAIAARMEAGAEAIASLSKRERKVLTQLLRRIMSAAEVA